MKTLSYNLFLKSSINIIKKSYSAKNFIFNL